MAAELSAVLLDANLLLWAHHRGFSQHERARAWMASALTEIPVVGIPWPSVLAFLRVSTHPRAFEQPLDIAVAWDVVHAELLREMLVSGRAPGNHTTDAHLAALAIEWGLLLVSADRDFARYPGLRWHDPSESW